MTDLSQNATTVLQNLRSHAEGDTSAEWGMIYLDNARHGMPMNLFRAQLAALSKAGLYKVVDGYAWGEVKFEN